MIRTKIALTIALLIPIITLAALTCYKKYILMSGQEVVLPISAYDPRDLLSGHYLRYSIDYNVPNICFYNMTQSIGYICLEKKYFSYTPLEGCRLFIQGVCEGGRFSADIEKFYIPENEAAQLEKEIRNKKASIVISVTSTGKAQVKDLLIGGQSFRHRQ